MPKYRLMAMVGVALVAALAVGGGLLTDALASHSNSVDVRVTARGTADGTGRVEFAIQQRLPNGEWGERKTGSARYMTPALIAEGTWKNATPVQIEIPADHAVVSVPTAAPTGGDGSRRSRPIAYGERFQAGVFDIQIVSVDTDAWPEIQVESQFNPPPAGKRFVLWTVQIWNQRGSFDEFEVAWEFGFQLVGNRGVEYTPAGESCGVNDLFERLYLGGSVTGTICVAVPIDEVGDGLTLRYFDSQSTDATQGKVSVWFDALP